VKIETLEEAKAYIAANFEKGSNCPCCNQMVKQYKYKLYDSSAVALIKLYNLTKLLAPETEFHVNQFAEKSAIHPRASHFAELRHWGLVQPSAKDVKGKKSSGYWSITDEGKKFVEGDLKVPEMIKMFNNECYGKFGDQIDIHAALGNKFKYEDIMNSYK
jgi:hypothetical protein